MKTSINTKEKTMNKATKMFVALIVAIAALVASGLLISKVASGLLISKPTYCKVSSVVAYPGDTLWYIAKINCYGNSTTNMVHDIMELNPELRTRYLQIGEIINLPMKAGR